ncbi:MAG TPA: response regulator [Planktothrix sp.]|jgi:DNA-binding response OmpR family regulator
MLLSKILIIDDDKNIVMIAQIGLSDTPEWDVITALSAQEGLEKALSEQPDLILLDMVMPDMDGKAALALLRGNTATAGTPVIFMTARAEKEEVEGYMRLGAVGVIVKPFEPMSLSSEIKTICKLPV